MTGPEPFNAYSRYYNLLYRDKDYAAEVDYVHINTPIPDHAPQSIAALKAGKHVACTVPMPESTDAVSCEKPPLKISASVIFPRSASQ